MEKVSPKDRFSNTPKQKRQLRSSSSRYMKPGALAQLRYTKTSTAKLCTDLGKKRIAVYSAKKAQNDVSLIENKAVDESPLMLSPVDLLKQNYLVRTPKTSRIEDGNSESKLESLPMDLLVETSSLEENNISIDPCTRYVKLLCHLHHDQLRAVFHVSQRIRKAVLIARQLHFNYTTPDRSRKEMFNTMTPRPTEHWPFASKGVGRGAFMSSPYIPKAPRHGPRPPSRIKITEMKQIAAVLFQGSAFPSRCMVPSALPKPLCKSLSSNRVLFYEDELCHSVAQNKLR